MLIRLRQHVLGVSKKAEYSQNKENILNNSHGFTVLLTQLTFSPSSQNKGGIILILIKAKSSCHMLNPLLTAFSLVPFFFLIKKN